ncbi:MAG: chemotaxis protein CheB [Luteimonas sp.]
MAPLIVGIGASAGGLEAFTSFLCNMPAESDMGFVLVQHLAPTHDSMLAELLGRHTSMPVIEAAEGMKVEPRHVYVIPPDATLTIVDGVLQLNKPAPPRQYRWPIDTFFTSLAEDQGDCAVSIVLSGTGSDGARGLRAVKEHGGLTLAQADFDHVALSGMPASAAATGLVDDVLPVEAMPARLLAHHCHLLEMHDRKGPDGTRQDLPAHLKEITDLMRAEVGHDFSQYKEKTLVRRIQRRMQVLQAATVPDYVAVLRKDPGETQQLFREILIGVTEFFRDPSAFAALQAVAIPALLQGKGAADTVRVWVPGCASGEEAYSIAILFKEAMTGLHGLPKVQIFATDIDERALEIARAGRYRRSQPGLSPQRRERWFIDDGDALCVAKSLREMCIFSTHSAIRDPAFSRLDLVSCRNLLIYMNPDLQEHVLRTFHYALKPGGFLLLGSSESLSRTANLFLILDKKHRLYARHGNDPSASPSLPPARDPGVGSHAIRVALAARRTEAENPLDREARRALEKHSPAYVVIDTNQEILRFAGDTGRYLGPSSGAASLNLFELLHRGLRGAARAAVQEASATRCTVAKENLSVDIDGRRQWLRLVVEPLPDVEGGGRGKRPGLCVVAFVDVPDPMLGSPGDAGEAGNARVEVLERELDATRLQLQESINQEETANEELKSANEEYQSVNEELQSTNEELETSKEEMQSINEELQAVNAELHGKNATLLHLNSDMQNLLDSTQIATLFLDSSLLVTNFTPAITELFHLRDGDRGRPITDITARIAYQELSMDVKQVMRTLLVRERELRNADTGTVFLLRMRPYRTLDNVIDGVVMTFMDITDRKLHEYERGRLAAIVDSSRDAIIGHALDGTIDSWNAGAERLLGYPVATVLGQPLSMLLPEAASTEMASLLLSCGQEQQTPEVEMAWLGRDGKLVEVALTCSPVRDSSGNTISHSTIARDISERKRTARHLQLMLAELNHRVKNTLSSVQAIAMQTLANAPTLEAFEQAFMSRLIALSNTHNLLAVDAWKGVGLREIVLAELAPYRQERDSRAEVSGEALRLDAKSALALGMALHELATNAGKYGALSVQEGCVDVHWETRPEHNRTWLRLRWVERNGPKVTPPTTRGFGTRLLSDGLGFELDGEVSLEFAAAGLVCIIDVPLPEADRSP